MNRSTMSRAGSYLGYVAALTTLILFIFIKSHHASDIGGLPVLLIPAFLLSVIASITHKPMFMYVSILLTVPLIFVWEPGLGGVGILITIPILNLLSAAAITFGTVRIERTSR